MPNQYHPGLIMIRPQYVVDTDSGDHPENVTWWQSTSVGTPSQANLQAIQAIFDSFWGSMWSQLAPSSKSYTGSVAIDWSSATGLENVTVGAFTPIVGALTGAGAPPQVAALLSYQIPLRWRGGHFRTYLPYLAASAVTGSNNDTLTSAIQAQLKTSFNSMLTGMNTTGVLGGQSFRVFKDKNKAGASTLWPITSFIVQPIVATQRRRVRKVAHH